jgi:hypothetical protein
MRLFFVWKIGTLNRMACLRSFNTNECGKAPDKRIGKTSVVLPLLAI